MSGGLVSSVLVDAVRVAVLLAASAPIAWLLARGPARVRSTLWLAVLAGALLTPAVARTVAPIEVSVPGWVAVAAPASAAIQPGVVHHIRSWTLDRAAVSDVSTARLEGGLVQPVPRERPAWSRVSAVVVAVWLWVAVAVALMVRTAAGYWRVARIVARARPVVDPEWTVVVRRAARRVGCRRSVRLLWTDELDVPATTGLLRPTVLLPAAADRWLIERREVVLMHEIVHIRRMDWAARIVARLVTCLHWFDPLAWWASSRLDREQERACDEAVLGAGVRASTYAAHLLEVARTARPRPAMSVPALELTRRTEVEDRIMRVLETRKWQRSAAMFGLPAIVIVGSLVPAIAAIRPAPPKPEASAAPQAVVATAAEDPAASPAVAPSPIAQAPPAVAPQSPAPAPAPPANPELSRLIHEVERLEAQMQPSIDEIDETVRHRIEERLREIEQVRIEIDEQRMAEIEARIEAQLAGIEDVVIDLEPVHAEIEEAARAIEALELDTGLDAEALREAIEPHVARLAELHEHIEPVQAQIAGMQESLEPLYREMEAVQEQMEERHLEMERLHAELEPLHAELERLHESLEPIQSELDRTAEQIDRAVVQEVESVVRGGLGDVVGSDAPFEEAARRIVAVAQVRIHDGVLTVDGPVDEVRTVLGDLMGSHRSSDVHEFDAALDATVQRLTPLRRSVDLD